MFTNLPKLQQLFQQGVKLESEKKHQEAIHHFQQVTVILKSKAIWDNYLTVSNKIACNFIYLSNIEAALVLLKHCLSIGLQELKHTHPLVSETYFNLAFAYKQKGYYNLALQNFESSLQIDKQLASKTSIDIFKNYNMIGVCYHAKGDYEQALQAFATTLSLQEKSLAKNDIEIAKTFNNLGTCYGKLGDYDKELLYLQKALHIRKQILGTNHREIAINYNNIGMSYYDREDYPKAIKHFHKALLIYRIFYTQVNSDHHPMIAFTYYNLGNCYGKLAKYEEQLTYLHKALNIQTQLFGHMHPYVAMNYQQIANSYENQQAHEQALFFYKKALAIRLETLGNQHPNTAITYHSIGLSFFHQQEYFTALQYCQKAIGIVTQPIISTAIYRQPILNKNSISLPLLDMLADKAVIFKAYYQQTQQKIDLLTALATYHLATELIEKLNYSYTLTNSKLLLNQKTHNIYEEAIQTSLQLYAITNDKQYLQEAFLFSEKGKSMLLRFTLNDTTAQLKAAIPAKLLNKAKKLRIELTYLTQKIQEEKANPTTANENIITDWQAKKFDYFRQYEEFITQLEKDYPTYYQLKYDIPTLSFSAFRKQIKKQTAVVSYFVGVNNIFIFLIKKTTLQAEVIPKPANLATLLQEVQQAINWLEPTVFVEKVKQLTQLLWQPIQQRLKNVKRVIILRDDILHNFPFEVLFTTLGENIKADFSTLPYLVKRFTISYHYAATLLLYSIDNQPKTKGLVNSFLGIAPINFTQSTQVIPNKPTSRSQLGDLPKSAIEVEKVSQFFKNRGLANHTLLYKQANKKTVLQYIGKYKYIIIATHGVQEDKQTQMGGIYLAANDKESVDFLSIAEAYNLSLQADLVVLSSCESGIGKLQKGEGMLALNRSFLSAGASNIIFSLFEIPDDTSQLLIERLFIYILEKVDYPTALRQAKLDMIANPKHTPQDWAGFVLIGS